MYFSPPLLLLLASTAIATSPPQNPLKPPNPSTPPSSDFQVFQSHISPTHSLRIKRQTSDLCATPVEQHTGWLDVGTRHLFFWYFAAESETPAAASALTLWLTGGPGVSSMTGMLQELGPCLINEYGNGTVYNPYGWNKDTALIFVDQPAGTGFSYVDEGEPLPSDSFMSAADMHVFLQLFMSQVFSQHKEGPLVITGESYGGHYLPTLGAEIVRQNALHPNQPQVPLKSLAIGNGYVSPLDTAYGYYETLCTTHPGVATPIFNETRCDIIATNLPRCISVAKICYEHPDPAICEAASRVCWEGVTSLYDSESYKGGRNRFDITAPCELDDLCYIQSAHIQQYLNTSAAFDALGVPAAVKEYRMWSEAIEQAFNLAGDIAITMKPELQFLLARQIDVLVYQGNLDLACNTAGAKRWTANMPWKGQAAFTSEDLRPWVSGEGEERKVAGKFKEVNVRMVEGDARTTRFALVTIDGSGHMVPQDQPAVALDMMTRWLRGEKFA